MYKKNVKIVSLTFLISVSFGFFLWLFYFTPANWNRLTYPQPQREYRRVSDRSGSINFEIPKEWEITENKLTGKSASLLSVQSPDFLIFRETSISSTELQSGMRVSLLVEPGTLLLGEGCQEILSGLGEVVIDSVPGYYFKYKVPTIPGAETEEYRFTYRGKVFYLSFEYHKQDSEKYKSETDHLLKTIKISKTN